MRCSNFVLTCFLTFLSLIGAAQSSRLTLSQQQEDFSIFVGGLREGHGGMFYFIDEGKWNRQADSVRQTLQEGATRDAFYLKLRYLVALLKHGHSRVGLPEDRPVNFKMAVLRNDRLYLPLQLLLIQGRLYVHSDCSEEQSVREGAEITHINGVGAPQLIASMMPYLFADGGSVTFKHYFLYNYFYFHFLYNLLYPAADRFELRLNHSSRIVRIKGRTPESIDKQYLARNKRELSRFEDPLQYRPRIAPGAAYLKVGSFYKGFIEGFGKRFEPFIDSVFRDLNRRGTATLILDLRNNEGGGDHYTDYLFARISTTPFMGFGFDQVAARKFRYQAYTVNLSDDLKAFLADPRPFLRDDSSLLLRPEFTDGLQPVPPVADPFRGRIYVLTNGGTFSAGNIMVRHLYRHRQATGRSILFAGEENGGDIYSDVQCAGQSYIIRLPHSAITVDMPFLCEGKLNTARPEKTLPDLPVYPTIGDVRKGKDPVLQSVLRHLSRHGKQKQN